MADIDKSLPNEVRTEIKIPGEEEISQEINVEEIVPEKGRRRWRNHRF
jgi:hypothetical protein